MNKSSDLFFSLKEVPMLYKRLFGKELDFYDMLEMVRIPMRKTNGLASKKYLLKGKSIEGELELPCNVYAIESVTTSKPLSFYAQWIFDRPEHLVNYRVDISGNQGMFNPDATMINQDPATNIVYPLSNIIGIPLGSYVPFHNNRNECLKFNFSEIEVDVIYVGMVVDSDGYPMVSEKVLEAIAYYMEFLDINIKYKNQQVPYDQLRVAEKQRDDSFVQAKTPDYLSNQEFDMIMNRMTSHSRKRHNLNMKF